MWFYLLPLGGYRLLHEPTFWLGAVYVTFPLGLLLYGWNDWADYETDRLNPRKGNFLFGAQLPPVELARLPWLVALVQLPFFAAFLFFIGWEFWLWIAAALLVNACYNLPSLNFKGRPLLDVLSQSGYLLVFVLSSWVNDVPQLPWSAMLFGLLFAMHSHLLGEIADIAPDRAAGRTTTAVVIGAARTKLVVAGLLLLESFVALTYFGNSANLPTTGDADYLIRIDRHTIAAFLAMAGIGFLIDWALRGGQTISDRALAGVLIAWNVVTLASMHFVWRSAPFVG